MSATAESVQLSFAKRAAAFAAAQGVTPFELPQLDGTPMRIREELVRWHGRPRDLTGRRPRRPLAPLALGRDRFPRCPAEPVPSPGTGRTPSR